MASTIQSYMQSWGLVNGIPLPKYDIKGLQFTVLPLGVGITREVARASYRKMREEHGRNPLIQTIFPNDPEKGANLFTRFAIAHYAELEGGRDYRLATPAILEQAIARAYKAVESGDHSFINYIVHVGEDIALIVFGAPGPNEKLRQHLLPQLRERDFRPEEAPVVVYRARTMRDNNFTESAGLRFDLADEKDVAFYAPSLLEPTFKFRGDVPALVENGLPSKLKARLGESARTLYTPTEKTGLRKLSRFMQGLDLSADNEHLDTPTVYSRVSFLVGAPPQDLEALAQLGTRAPME